MSVTALLTELRERGVLLEARGDRLRYAPREAVPEELRAKIVEYKPALLRLLTEAPQPCPKCGAPLIAEAGDHHRHTYCPAGCVDRWEATQPGGLSGAFGEPTGHQMVSEAIARYECPGCGGALMLQDKARDAWFCAGCRLWCVEGGAPVSEVYMSNTQGAVPGPRLKPFARRSTTPWNRSGP